MKRSAAEFSGSVAISAVATVLLLIAITGARKPAGVEAGIGVVLRGRVVAPPGGCVFPAGT